MTKGFHAEPTGNTVNMNCRIRQNKDRPDLYPSSEYQVRWYWKQSIACCSEDTKPPNVSGKNHKVYLPLLSFAKIIMNKEFFVLACENPSHTLNFRIQIFKMRKTRRSISQILEFFSIQIQQRNQSTKNLE